MFLQINNGAIQLQRPTSDQLEKLRQIKRDKELIIGSEGVDDKSKALAELNYMHAVLYATFVGVYDLNGNEVIDFRNEQGQLTMDHLRDMFGVTKGSDWLFKVFSAAFMLVDSKDDVEFLATLGNLTGVKQIMLRPKVAVPTTTH